MTEWKGPQIVSIHPVDQFDITGKANKRPFHIPGSQVQDNGLPAFTGKWWSSLIVADENNSRRSLSREIFDAYAKTILCLHISKQISAERSLK